MPGSSNFLQWNNGQANQETDAQYTADAARQSGAGNGAIFASATANKLFYQLSTFITAFGTALANKGYVLSDANIATLATVLANVMTAADMSVYPLKTDFPLVSNSGITNYTKLSNGTIFQWGTGGVGNGTTLTLPTTFPQGIYQVAAVNIGGGAGVPTAKMVCPQAVNGSSFKVWVYDQTGTISSTNISWIAIGF